MPSSSSAVGANALDQPLLIEPYFSPRIWGTPDLRRFYPELGLFPEPVGESWLTADHCRLASSTTTLAEVATRHRAELLGNQINDAPENGFPLLVKLLFPNDRLSVQVHPDDSYAAAHGLGRGKTEMWYVLDAHPNAKLAVNLLPGKTVSDLADACRAGRGADILSWISVKPGDVIFLPAGTVHALGPGMVLCEVQQQSDNTFRLDDYGRKDSSGRPRELHLEHGLAVARANAGGGKLPRQSTKGPVELLIESEYFRVEKIALDSGKPVGLESRFRIVVPLEGSPRLQVGSREVALPLARAVVITAAAAEPKLHGPCLAISATLPAKAGAL